MWFLIRQNAWRDSKGNWVYTGELRRMSRFGMILPRRFGLVRWREVLDVEIPHQQACWRAKFSAYAKHGFDEAAYMATR